MANEFNIKNGFISNNNSFITGNLTVTASTQSLFSGNSSSELVKIIQNGSGDAFVVQDVANGDASHFVINGSGNTAIGLTQPLNNDKLTVSGNTTVYGTLSATTFAGLPTDIRVTGGTYSSGTAIFTNNTGGTFSVTGFNTGSTASPISVISGSSLFSTGLSNTGTGASGVTYSLFLGQGAGYLASAASYSTFIGDNAGSNAKNSNNSVFLGPSAGINASASSYSIFIGDNAGQTSTNVIEGNFIGYYAGNNATGASYSTFIGTGAGESATDAQYSIFIGGNAGTNANSATSSHFMGTFAGFGATNANNSNFFGPSAGNTATYAYFSNFIGTNAGNAAVFASTSNFMGNQAGSGATNANNSNFFGENAGYAATNANSSIFIGTNAGTSAVNAANSIFVGSDTGGFATNSIDSVFIGTNAGNSSSNANNSVFLGKETGLGATNASYSNFIGMQAGYLATGATYSNLFGYRAGYTSTVDKSIGRNNIIIGTNITLSANTSNALNIGGVLFGTGIYSATTGTTYTGVSSTGKIGINVVNPSATLHVSGNTLVQGSVSATTVSATTYLNLPSGVVGSGTTNYLARWTGSTGLSNSLIRDDGTNIGINTAPSSQGKVYIYSNTGSTSALYVQNQSTASSYGIWSFMNSGQGSQTAILGIAEGHPTTGTSIGLLGFANDGLLGIGVKGAVGTTEFGTMTTGIGGSFDGRGDGGYGYPSISYSVQLLDGTEGVNKVLVSQTSDGKANWSSSLTGLTSVSATTVSATTFIGDGSQITNVTPSVPYGIITAMATGNYLI